jgi:hypothetical protein
MIYYNVYVFILTLLDVTMHKRMNEAQKENQTFVVATGNTFSWELYSFFINVGSKTTNIGQKDKVFKKYFLLLVALLTSTVIINMSYVSLKSLLKLKFLLNWASA